MLLPGRYTHLMEIFLASLTILKILVIFIHLRKADSAVSIVLKIDFLGLLLLPAHPTFQPVCKLLVQHFICSFGHR